MRRWPAARTASRCSSWSGTGGTERAFFIAFDLIELNGDDLRTQALDRRKATLARLLTRSTIGIQLNEYLEHDDGALVFEHACRLGLEGVVSKHKRSQYRSGRTELWVKMNNPRVQQRCGSWKKGRGRCRYCLRLHLCTIILSCIVLFALRFLSADDPCPRNLHQYGLIPFRCLLR